MPAIEPGARSAIPQGPEVAVAGVVVDDGRLLVVRRGKAPQGGRWSVPGGGVRGGEHLREAVAREVVEETGIEVEVGGLAWWLEHIDDDHHYVILDFHARPVGGQLRAGGDALEVRWADRAELEGMDTTAGLLDYLDRGGVELA